MSDKPEEKTQEPMEIEEPQPISDKGVGVKIGIAADGRIVQEFDREYKYIAYTPAQARKIAVMLSTMADKAEQMAKRQNREAKKAQKRILHS